MNPGRPAGEPIFAALDGSPPHPFATKDYAEALGHWGRPLAVPEWGTWVMVRAIAGELEDAAGTYPIAVLNRGADLKAGLRRLADLGLVSVVLVLDDFHRPPLPELERCFDHVRAFKIHFVYRPSHGPLAYDRHHRYKVRRALRNVEVGRVDLSGALSAWRRLYASLVDRHSLTGLHAFPDSYHAALSRLNGVEAIGAWNAGALVCCHLWVTDQRSAYSLLVASSPEGYRYRAAYAVNDAALRLFADHDVVNFGGSAGTANEAEDGLVRFKKGFANDTAPSYICGKILNHQKYQELVQARNISECCLFFPAYRETV